jgi:hypothetical protein
MFVCCDCCVWSGRGLCDELITRPEESYRLWCITVCDPQEWGGHDPRWVATPQHKKSYICIYIWCLFWIWLIHDRSNILNFQTLFACGLIGT